MIFFFLQTFMLTDFILLVYSFFYCIFWNKKTNVRWYHVSILWQIFFIWVTHKKYFICQKYIQNNIFSFYIWVNCLKKTYSIRNTNLSDYCTKHWLFEFNIQDYLLLYLCIGAKWDSLDVGGYHYNLTQYSATFHRCSVALTCKIALNIQWTYILIYLQSTKSKHT